MSHMDEFGRHEVLHMTLFLAGAVDKLFFARSSFTLVVAFNRPGDW
jgi:hypothetical protein